MTTQTSAGLRTTEQGLEHFEAVAAAHRVYEAAELRRDAFALDVANRLAVGDQDLLEHYVRDYRTAVGEERAAWAAWQDAVGRL